MNINPVDIDIFKSLSEYSFDGVYYDFHNDYVLLELSLHEYVLNLRFKKSKDNQLVSLNFHNTYMFDLHFFNSEQNLSIDMLYRGRFVKGNKLLEFSDDGKAYFFLQFCDGQKIEFFSDLISIDKR